MITITEYTMHMIRLIMMAENPKVITRSLKKGTGVKVFESPVTGFPASTLLKIVNSKNAILQISVNLEKKEMTFIMNVLKISSAK